MNKASTGQVTTATKYIPVHGRSHQPRRLTRNPAPHRKTQNVAFLYWLGYTNRERQSQTTQQFFMSRRGIKPFSMTTEYTANLDTHAWILLASSRIRKREARQPVDIHLPCDETFVTKRIRVKKHKTASANVVHSRSGPACCCADIQPSPTWGI